MKRSVARAWHAVGSRLLSVPHGEQRTLFFCVSCHNVKPRVERGTGNARVSLRLVKIQNLWGTCFWFEMEFGGWNGE